MFDTFRFRLVLAGLVTVFASSALAETGTIKLSEIVAQSETVAIVKLVELPPDAVPRRARLNVLRVLKGHLGTGVQEVNYAEYGYPDREPGEFVAFLDKERNWRFNAAPLQGRNVESGLLLVSAFAARNAPFVSPGYLSLAQLTIYLKTGRLVYSFSGPLWFPQRGKPSWGPSGMRIEGTYDAVRESAHVAGLGQLAGFPAEPWVSLRGRYEKPRFLLRYSDGGQRPLEIKGEIEGLDQRTGSMIARFAIIEPDILSEATLAKYLADPRLGRCYYKFRLHCLAAKEYPKLDLLLNLDEYSEDRLKCWGSGPLEIDTADLTINSEAGYEAVGLLRDAPGQHPHPFAKAPADGVLRVVTVAREGQTVVLDINVAKPKNDKDVPRWEFVGGWGLQSELLYRVNSAPAHGTLSLHDGKALRAITTFSVDIDPVTFGPVFGK